MKTPKRNEIPEEYKWKLSHMYSDNESWEKDFSSLKEMLPKVSALCGKLSDSSESLLSCLQLSSSIERLYEKVLVYAHMSSHQDTADSLYQGYVDRVDSLGVEISSTLSYIVPEILSIPDETLNSFLIENKSLELYRRQLSEIIRTKPHVLSSSEEQLLAMAGEMKNSPDTIFSMITNADMKFPSIKADDGSDIEITNGRFISLLENSDRKIRKDAFEAYYSSFQKQNNTLAATLNANIKANLFYSRARKYSSARESFLFSDNVKEEVYDNLIDTIHKNMHLMHRYVSLRKQMLELDELHMYDIYTPIVKDISMDIPYAKAVETVEKGLEVMGEQYVKDLHTGLNSGWIDIYENEGKRSGAYSWGCYDSHPYVLLNHTNTLDSMFTLAHEMGHALHSFYSNKHRPYEDSHYTIFVAEVASTCNESLLMNYLLKTTTDKKQKLYLLNRYMDNFRTTVYRQTMFGEFEKLIHAKAEAGEPLTCDALCSIYRELNVKYYGPDIVIDEQIDLEWARIPHFYSSFYVYKYATGFSAAVSLSKGILSGDKNKLENYLKFLKSGGSDYPLELLKKAGVDMTTPAPIQEALNVFKDLLDEFEVLMNEK